MIHKAGADSLPSNSSVCRRRFQPERVFLKCVGFTYTYRVNVQGVAWVADITVGDDFLGIRDQKSYQREGGIGFFSSCKGTPANLAL